MIPGPLNLITDVSGLRVGNAEDHTLKSGTTVLTADAPFTASHHTMGGAPGTRETDLLAPDKSVAQVDALVLSGGSAFGLDACAGVVDGLRADGRGFAVGPATVPIVPGAILFDLVNGGDKDWPVSPYPAFGRAAYANAAKTFDIGSVGAGTGALTANLKGGLGSASLMLDNGVTVGALVAANPVGHVVTPNGHLWAAPFEMRGEFGNVAADATTGHVHPFVSEKVAMMLGSGEGANTTIAIVATDAGLDKAQCQRMAIAAHDGIARAIVPAHTPMDGDLVFGVSTGDRGSDVDLTQICHAAALCLSRAIGRAVVEATPADGDLLPCFGRT